MVLSIILTVRTKGPEAPVQEQAQQQQGQQQGNPQGQQQGQQPQNNTGQ